MRLRSGIGGLLVACLLASGACTELLIGDKQFVHDDSATGGDGGGGSSTDGSGATGGSGASGPAPVCENGTTACDGACVLLGVDSSNCGACGHDCLGATCQSGLCTPEEVVSSVTDPRGLAVDATHVYWTTGDGSVQRAPKAGGAVETLADQQGSPRAVALDDMYAYWVDEDSGRVVRMVKDGQSKKAKTLLTNPGLQGLAVDTDGLYLSRKLKKGDIRRVDKDGGGPKSIASAQPQPSRIGLLGDRVLWTGQIEDSEDDNGDGKPDGGEGMAGSYVRWAPRSGGEPTTLARGEGLIVELVVAGDTAVWADSKTLRIRAGAPGDSAAVTLEEGQDVRGLAADGDQVFWTSAGGTVRQLSTKGGPSRVVAIDIPGAGAAALDSAYVYFTRSGPGGAIYRVAR